MRCEISNCRYQGIPGNMVLASEKIDDHTIKFKQLRSFCWLHLPKHMHVVVESDKKLDREGEVLARNQKYRYIIGKKTDNSVELNSNFTGAIYATINNGITDFSESDRQNTIIIPADIKLAKLKISSNLSFSNVEFLGNFSIENLSSENLSFGNCTYNGEITLYALSSTNVRISGNFSKKASRLLIDGVNHNGNKSNSLSISCTGSADTNIYLTKLNVEKIEIKVAKDSPCSINAASIGKSEIGHININSDLKKLSIENVKFLENPNISSSILFSRGIPDRLFISNSVTPIGFHFEIANHGAGIDCQRVEANSITITSPESRNDPVVDYIKFNNGKINSFDISSCRLSSPLNLLGTYFSGVLKIEPDVIGHGAELPLKPHFSLREGSYAEICYRKLFKLFEQQGDHLQAGIFFSLEHDCMNHREAQKRKTRLGRWLFKHFSWSAWYSRVSDYGMNITKPLQWLFALVIISTATLGFSISDCHNPLDNGCNYDPEKFRNSFEFSIKYLALPFGAWRFPPESSKISNIDVLYFQIGMTPYAMIGLTFIYLFMLGLRWRFRQR